MLLFLASQVATVGHLMSVPHLIDWHAGDHAAHVCNHGHAASDIALPAEHSKGNEGTSESRYRQGTDSFGSPCSIIGQAKTLDRPACDTAEALWTVVPVQVARAPECIPNHSLGLILLAPKTSPPSHSFC